VAEPVDSKAENFRHMELSYKGSERQRPSILQQTLRLQHILEASGRAITESNILLLVDEWNNQPFVIAVPKWKISKAGRIAITNLSVSVTRVTLDIMVAHLHWWKWAECCALLEQIRGRWCGVGCVTIHGRSKQPWCQSLIYHEHVQPPRNMAAVNPLAADPPQASLTNSCRANAGFVEPARAVLELLCGRTS
jgi:hypothetical protein